MIKWKKESFGKHSRNISVYCWADLKLARENPELSSSCDVLLHIIILVSNWSVDNDSAAQVLDHRLNMVYKKCALGQAG